MTTDVVAKLSLSDDEDDAQSIDENDPDLYSTNIRKNLIEAFSEPTPLKLTRHSILHTREQMRVFLRIRPFTEAELNAGENQNCMSLKNRITLTMRSPKDSFAFKSSLRGFGDMTHNFTFTNIFGSDTMQKTFFDETMLSTVRNFVDGQNCLVFTYGVTNAGKTHTIQGTPQDGGILPRTLDVIFNSIDGRQYDSMKLKPRYFCDVVRLSARQEQIELKIKAAVLAMAGTSKEVLEADSLEATCMDVDMSNCSSVNDDSTNSDGPSMSISTLHATQDITLDATTLDDQQSIMNDILNRIPEDTSVDVEAQGPVKFAIWISFAEIYNEYIFDLLEPIPKGKKARRQSLKLAVDKRGSIFIKGLKEIHVCNADEAYKVLKIGQRNLSIAATKMNHNSSRSHCIFSIKILRVVDVAEPHVARVSMLSFCDLAGSERVTKTMNTGERLKEAGNINTSLLTLGKCIHGLRYNQNHPSAQPKVIPFRESKLTHLFQSFFCGKGLASMIVNVNQCASGFDETMHVLKFSAIAKQVTTVTSKLDNKWEIPKAKSKLVSARALSIAVDKAVTSGKDRPSIPWATPRTMAKELQTARDLTSIDEDESIFEDEESEEEDDEATPSADPDKTPNGDGVNGASRKVLLEVIEILKKELVTAKEKLISAEAEIRAEVCNEMAKHIVEIEANYNERLQEEKEIAEEVFEKRLEILSKSVKKAKGKRARVDHDDDEGDYVPAMMYVAEQVKVEKRDERLNSLTAENGKLKKQIEDIEEILAQVKKTKSNEIAELSAEKDKVTGQVTDQLFKIDELHRKVTAAKQEGEEQLKRLTNQIKELIEGSASQEKTIADLQRKMQEQSQDNSQQEEESAQIEQLTTERNQLMEKFTKQEETILKLQGDVQDLSRVEQEKVQGLVLQLTEQVKELERVHAAEMKKAEENKKEKEQKIGSLMSQNEDQATKLRNMESRVKILMEEAEGKMETSDIKIGALMTQNEEQATKLRNLESRNKVLMEEAETKIQQLTDELEVVKEESEKLQEQLSSAERRKDELGQQGEQRISELTKENDQLQDKVNELQHNVDNLSQRTHKEEEVKMNMWIGEKENLNAMMTDLNARNNELIAQNEDLKKLGEEAEKKFDEEKTRTIASRKENEVQIAELTSRLTEEYGMAEAEIVSLTEEREKLKSFTSELEEKLVSLTEEALANNEEYKEKVSMLIGENKEQKKTIDDLMTRISQLEESLTKSNEECAIARKEKEELRATIIEWEKKLLDLTVMATELNESKVNDAKVSSLMKEKEESDKEISELKETIKELENKVIPQESGDTNELRPENEKLVSTVAKMESQLNALQESLKTLQSKYEIKEMERKEIQEALDREITMRDDLFQKKTEMAEEMADLNEKHKEACQKQQEAEVKTAALEAQVTDLKESLEKEQKGLKTSLREVTVLGDEIAFLKAKEAEGRVESKGKVHFVKFECPPIETTNATTEEEEKKEMSILEPESTNTSMVEIDATPLTKKKRQTRRVTRGRKRKSSDLLEEELDIAPKRSRKPSTSSEVKSKLQNRRATRSIRSRSIVDLTQDQENIPEEAGKSPSIQSASSSEDLNSRRGAFSKLGDMLSNSPLGRQAKRIVGAASSMTSPSRSPPTMVEVVADGKKKKRKLYKTDISAPFECSPFEVVTVSESRPLEQAPRITRNLRSRTRKI